MCFCDTTCSNSVKKMLPIKILMKILYFIMRRVHAACIINFWIILLRLFNHFLRIFTIIYFEFCHFFGRKPFNFKTLLSSLQISCAWKFFRVVVDLIIKKNQVEAKMNESIKQQQQQLKIAQETNCITNERYMNVEIMESV